MGAYIGWSGTEKRKRWESWNGMMKRKGERMGKKGRGIEKLVVSFCVTVFLMCGMALSVEAWQAQRFMILTSDISSKYTLTGVGGLPLGEVAVFEGVLTVDSHRKGNPSFFRVTHVNSKALKHPTMLFYSFSPSMVAKEKRSLPKGKKKRTKKGHRKGYSKTPMFQKKKRYRFLGFLHGRMVGSPYFPGMLAIQSYGYHFRASLVFLAKLSAAKAASFVASRNTQKRKSKSIRALVQVNIIKGKIVGNAISSNQLNRRIGLLVPTLLKTLGTSLLVKGAFISCSSELLERIKQIDEEKAGYFTQKMSCFRVEEVGGKRLKKPSFFPIKLGVRRKLKEPKKGKKVRLRVFLDGRMGGHPFLKKDGTIVTPPYHFRVWMVGYKRLPSTLRAGKKEQQK